MLWDSIKQLSSAFVSKRALPPIEIFVRHCNFSDISAHKKRPSWFSRKACFENLITTLKGESSVNVTVLLDTFQPMQQRHFVHQQSVVPVIETCQGTEGGSFCFMLDLAFSKKVSDDTIIYFLEDDYLHRKGWVNILREGIALKDVSYVTLYDHKDKYFLPSYKDLASKLYVTSSSHWRQTPSTTNTFAATFATLKRDAEVHYKFSKGKKISEDHAKFLKLGEQGAMLISPIPGWSSHLEPEYASPCIDWHDIQKQTTAAITS